jgi:hypothetical protein
MKGSRLKSNFCLSIYSLGYKAKYREQFVCKKEVN